MKNLIISVLLFVLVATPIFYNPPAPQPVIVAAKVLDSVVTIECLGESEITLIIPGLDKKTVSMWSRVGMGSGIVIGDGSYVATCAHVVKGIERFAIRVDKEHEAVDATTLYINDELDLAVLKLNTPKRFKAAEFSFKEPRVGDTVYAVGNPFGIGKSFSSGIVNRLHDGFRQLDSIVFDASTNPGNSGGALFDANGRLIGIVWGIYSPRALGQAPTWAGIGLASPIQVLAAQLPGVFAQGAAVVNGCGEPPTP